MLAAMKSSVIALHRTSSILNVTTCTVAMPEHITSGLIDTIDRIFLSGLIHIRKIGFDCRLAET